MVVSVGEGGLFLGKGGMGWWEGDQQNAHPQDVQGELRHGLLGVKAGDVAPEGHHEEEEGVGVALWWFGLGCGGCVCVG